MDLADPVIANHHHKQRFVARVCTVAERPRVHDTPDPKATLWSLFAAKEAAYKVAVKLGYQPGFAHRAFEVAADLRSVRYREHVFALSIDVTDERVHAVAATSAGDITSDVAPAPAALSAGAAVRELLCAAVGRALACEPGELAVVRPRLAGSWDGFAPPHVVRCGEAVAVDVSLSHDGRFVAFAFAATS